MTKMTDEQQQLLNRLEARTQAKKTVREKIMLEAEARADAESASIEADRRNIVRVLVTQFKNTPRTRIGKALGMSYYPDVKAYVEGIENTEAVTEVAEKFATAHEEDDTLTVTLVNWPELGSGDASFTRMDGEWMASTYDEFTQAVERALFGEEKDEALVSELGL